MHAKPSEELKVERSGKGSAGSQVSAIVAEPTEWSPQPETLN